MRGVRAAIAIVAVGVVGFAALQLSRVDTDVGPALGPDRAMRLADVGTSAPASERVVLARDVLAARPLDGRAYRVLALAQDKPQLLDVANARWPRDPMTLASLTDRALAAGDIAAGLTHFDALLRVAPGVRAEMLPLLLPHLHDARVREALVDRLAQDPPWRHAFLRGLREDTAYAADSEALLAALATRVPPDEDALRTRIDVLDHAGRPADARRAWLASVHAAEANPVFDGAFEHPEIQDGYGWRLGDVPGVLSEYATDAPQARGVSLSLEFEDRAIASTGVQQKLALPPGRYRLQSAALDRVASERPFEWRIACRDGARIASLPLARTGEWTTQSVDFEVPSDCEGQTLLLANSARSMAEKRLRGRLLVDDVGIFLVP
ncbi:hypothetical protein LVB87_09555 [Lysobacter sp. KIS68-7]|uniref:hypothetical protein n=1 Tax=Lysobacter sp. KIS68-7 TaxID=2904252 RepID=UPI001E3C4A10|nr:hypothetical protein [Lysobacter sp. KIS68-7]UHQ18458.1 hypothetical protein LVB87_09555 [Lysobacter sp. KIS68-7]